MGWSCIGRSLMGLRVACSENETCAWHNRNIMHNTIAGIVTKLTPPSGEGAATCTPALALTLRGSSDTSTFS